MATYAPVAYTTAASNTQIDFDITFTFLRATDVVVSVIDPNGNVLVNGTDYDAELQAVNDGTFDMRIVQAGTLTTTQDPLAANHVISLKRNTDVSQIVTVFQDGASFKAADINAIITQLFNKIQEVEVSSGEGIGLTDDLVAFDAENKPLRNLGTPTADNDAMRKVDIDSGIGPAVTTVAGISSDVTTVASGTDTSGRLHRLNIEDVADDLNLGANSDITTVATDIRTGGNNHVQAVSNSIANVDTLAGNDTDGTAHLVNIETVAENLTGTNTIGTVAGSIANVNTLAGNDAGGTAHLTNISDLAPQVTNIDTLASGTDSGGTAYLTHLENAATNAAAAQAALEAFNRTYLGAYSADPTADNNGDPLTDGDLYYNTASNNLKFYDAGSTVWVTLNNSVQVNAAATLGATGDVTFTTESYQDFIMRDNSNPAKWINVSPSVARTNLGLGTAAVAETTDFLQPGDVVDDVTTGGTQVPLSAEQGVELKSLIDTNAAAIATKQANITTSSGTINAQSLTTYVTGDSGSVSVDVRKANHRTTTGTHSLLGGATMYYANAAATYDTANLTAGDIVTIYNEGGGTVTVNTGGTVSLFKDGEASAVTTAVTIGADTIATVTCVSATKAIIAGSDLT